MPRDGTEPENKADEADSSSNINDLIVGIVTTLVVIVIAFVTSMIYLCREAKKKTNLHHSSFMSGY